MTSQPPSAHLERGVRDDGGYVGKCTSCHDHYWNYWGRGTYCPACLAGYVDSLNEELGVSGEEIEQAVVKIDDLRRALEQARDLVAEAYSDQEDNDSPGNMAFAVLNHALEEASQ